MDAKTEKFSEGLLSLFGPALEECDSCIQDVYSSQSELSLQIDTLSSELEKFMNFSKTPSLSPYVDKLNAARQRMNNINALLVRINTRLDNIQLGMQESENG